MKKLQVNYLFPKNGNKINLGSLDSKELFKIKCDILREAYEASIHYQDIYKLRKIEDLKSQWDHEKETITIIQELDSVGLINYLKGDYCITITPKGKKFIKQCIRLGFEKMYEDLN